MPYINSELRNRFDASLQDLAEDLRTAAAELGGDNALKGLLNYCITRLGTLTLPARGYGAMSMIRAAMLDAADEWYRRVMAPYEDAQAEKNGDVYEGLP